MGRLEQVKRAIKRNNPEYVPVLYFNDDRSDSDLIMIDVVRHFMGEERDYSEWGFRWDRVDGTMGHPAQAVLEDWKNLPKLAAPDPRDTDRFASVRPTMDQYGSDRYYLASLVLTGFTVMTFLRGFAPMMEDFYLERENAERLADMVFGFEEDIVGQLGEFGFHGAAFFDDWGTQTGLFISPQLWREFIKPRYKRLFDRVHAEGLDVYFHCCGQIYEIIPDLLEIGVDMLNLSQPNLFDLDRLDRDFGGRTCFVCPISYQTTMIRGNRDDIYADADRLVRTLGRRGGGLIGYVEAYGSIGISDENFRHSIDPFRTLGVYRK